MPAIDPSPDADELGAIETCLKNAAKAITAYLNTPAGQADPDGAALTTAALNLLTDVDDLSTTQLNLSVANGGQAADAINKATAELQKAIDARAAVTHDLGIVQDIAAFAAAVIAGNVGTIITTGQTLFGDLKPATGAGGAKAGSGA